MMRAFGWRRSEEHTFALDRNFGHLGLPSAGLPDDYDLLKYQEPVLDQLGAQSCVGNQIADALRTATRLKAGPGSTEHPELASRLHIYRRARGYEGEPISDTGTYIRNGIRAPIKFGAPPESAWPYSDDPERVNAKIPQSVERLGWAHRGPHAYYRIFEDGSARVEAIRQAIFHHGPVVLGIAVDDAFIQNTGPHLIKEPIGTLVGRHCVSIIGYAQDTNFGGVKFLMKNCWGESWRNGGYVWLNERYIRHPETADPHTIEL